MTVTFGGVHEHRRASVGLVRFESDLLEQRGQRFARGVERGSGPVEDAGLVAAGHGSGHGAAGAEVRGLEYSPPDVQITGDHVVRALRLDRGDLVPHPLSGMVDRGLDQLRTTAGDVRGVRELLRHRPDRDRQRRQGEAPPFAAKATANSTRHCTPSP
jgi:hypothetical protein